MQQSRVEPYVGTSGSLREASPDAAPTSLNTDPQLHPDARADDERWVTRSPDDDQFTVSLGAEAERTFDIPISDAAISDESEQAAVDEHEVQSGDTLRNRYVLHRLIGTGGTCRVFLAEDRHRRLSVTESGELIALKLLRQSLRHTPHSLQRLRREFLQMQQLTHPAITRVFDLDCDGDLWFMTMELVDAPSALTWMSGEYSQADALRLILACCEAVDYAHHRGIVHGDLKPGNVLVMPDGAVKLIDFGSVAGSSEPVSDPLKLEATPQYASPAVLAGNMAEVCDDVFSLGCLAYMALAHGRHPFERKPSSEAASARLRAPYIPGVPVRLFEVIARALAWDPLERHGSVDELQQALLVADTALSHRPARPARHANPGANLGAKPGAASHAHANPGAGNANGHSTTRNSRSEAPAHEREPEVAPAARGARDKPAHTPGDLSYLSKFRGYVAGPLMGEKPPDSKLHREVHEEEEELDATIDAEPLEGHEQALPAEPPGAAVAQQPLYMPAAAARAALKRPQAKRSQPPPSRLKSAAVNVLGMTLVLVSAIVAALWSRPQPTHEVVAQGPRNVMPALNIPTPVMEPEPLPVMRLPKIRIASTKADKVAERRRPSADKAASGPSVSFDSRAVAVSPTQKLVAIPLRRSSANNGVARVAWQIEGERGRQLLDTARAGNQVIQFHAGQEQRTLYVPLRKEAGEFAADGVRTFRVKLRQVDGGPAPGQVPEIRVTLLD